MSTLKVDTITKADGTGSMSVPAETGSLVTTEAGSVESAMTTQLGRRNLIINGAMQVAQRGTSVTGITGSGYKTVDRFQFQETGSAIVTMTQESSGTRPVGFDKFARIEITTADSTTDSSDKMALKCLLETQDLHCLNYGTSDAKDVTLSFWVRSSVSGTYSIAFYHQASTSYSYSTSYTISSADTWEYKTITVPGNTAQAHDNDDNSSGLQVRWMLSAGSGTTQTADTWEANANNWGVSGQTQLTETSNATFDLTGVQLEVGSVATPFEHRSYGEELALCQRYYQVATMQDFSWVSGNTTALGGNTTAVVEMRATPTFTALSSTASNYNVFRPGTGNAPNEVPSINNLCEGGRSLCIELTATSWQHSLGTNLAWAGRTANGTFAVEAEL